MAYFDSVYGIGVNAPKVNPPAAKMADPEFMANLIMENEKLRQENKNLLEGSIEDTKQANRREDEINEKLEEVGEFFELVVKAFRTRVTLGNLDLTDEMEWDEYSLALDAVEEMFEDRALQCRTAIDEVNA